MAAYLYSAPPLCSPLPAVCSALSDIRKGPQIVCGPSLYAREMLLSPLFYLTRSVRPMRRIVVDLMPFRRQMFETVVP